MKLNGFEIHGKLTGPMTGKTAEQYIMENYRVKRSDARALVRAAWDYKISARASANGKFAIHLKRRAPAVRFVIEESENSPSDSAVSVAVRPGTGYTRPIARGRKLTTETTNRKETIMAATATRRRPATVAKSPAKSPAKPAPRGRKPAPVEEPAEVEEELEEELEDELDEDELEDEEDEDLEDELEEDEEEEEDEEDADEEDEESDETADEAEEEEGEEQEQDLTPYLNKGITPTMAAFSEWIDLYICQPGGTTLEELAASDPARVVAVAGTTRMIFQASAFNKQRREEAKAEAAAARAAKAQTAKATAKAAPGKKPVAKGRPAAVAAPARGKARPASAKATTARPAARTTSTASPKATPIKTSPAKRTAPARKKGPAPY